MDSESVLSVLSNSITHVLVLIALGFIIWMAIDFIKEFKNK